MALHTVTLLITEFQDPGIYASDKFPLRHLVLFEIKSTAEYVFCLQTKRVIKRTYITLSRRGLVSSYFP